MNKPAVKILLATVAMYCFGFLYWGLSGAPYKTWKQAPDDVAAGQALLQHFPESGLYHVPSINHPEKEREELFRRGPVGFVKIRRPGRELHDVSIMINGFLLSLAASALLWLVLKKSALTTYGSRLVFVALLGVTASVMIDGGDVVWWQTPILWKLAQGVYNVGAWIMAGLVLARADA
jgi:hypothetical protein